MKRLILWVPLGIFLLFVITVSAGLYSPAERTIRSASSARRYRTSSCPPCCPSGRG
jgi:hypothetical protein